MADELTLDRVLDVVRSTVQDAMRPMGKSLDDVRDSVRELAGNVQKALSEQAAAGAKQTRTDRDLSEQAARIREIESRMGKVEDVACAAKVVADALAQKVGKLEEDNSGNKVRFGFWQAVALVVGTAVIGSSVALAFNALGG